MSETTWTAESIAESKLMVMEARASGLWIRFRDELINTEGRFEGSRTYTDFDTLAEHDPRCPVALARQIREGQP